MQVKSFSTHLNPWVLGVGSLTALLATPVVFVFAGLFSSAGPAWRHAVSEWLPHCAANSLFLLAGSGGLALVCGTVPAWLVAVYRFPGRRLFEWVLVLPLALPAYISAYAYAGLFDFQGAVPLLLGRLLPGDGIPRIDVMNIYGAILVMGFGLYPYVYLTARACFVRQSAAALEAARALGQTPLRAFFSVVLPLARPALVGGTLLVGMEVLNEYGAVKYFGVDTFTTGIFTAWFSLCCTPEHGQ